MKNYKDGFKMTFTNYSFQTSAVNRLYETYAIKEYGGADKKTTILEAPTGSGKTAILIRLMDRILERDQSQKIAFVWLTPGAGELEEQSWAKTSQNARTVEPVFLEDSLTVDGFLPGTVTFLNWEMVNNKHNIALKDGDRTNLDQAIETSRERGVKFILIIDEEHRNKTHKAQKIINKFNASMIFKASATPTEEKSANLVKVTEEDVIAEGIITRAVVLNDQFSDGGSEEELHAGDDDFLDSADNKRRQINNDYKERNKDINTLVLVQFPDEKKYDLEVKTKVKQVHDYLVNELGQREDQIATWMSGEHRNIESISKNNSKVNYLLMKQAVSTGWDAPRAKILVKLRLNTSHDFTIQTIGRIRRMPERHHYNDELLDNSYVYSNDSKYVYDIIKSGAGAGITQMGLHSSIPTDIFNVQSIKLKVHPYKDVEAVTHSLRNEFVNEFHLTNSVKDNEEKLKDYNWDFSREIKTKIRAGKTPKLEDFAAQTVELPNSIPITDVSELGYRYDAVMDSLKPWLHVGDDLRRIRAIISDLIAIGEPGSDVKPILQLNTVNRYAFVINNVSRLKEVVRNMDARYSSTFNEQITLSDSYVDYIPFNLPARDGYPDNGSKGKLLEKNVYLGYTTSNWVKQSKAERMIEEQLNSMPKVKWFYRSKDHGRKYFSIVYNGVSQFFPDYLVKTQDGTTYILETKGAEGQNIDKQAHNKFKALKDYVNNHCDNNVSFAFVRPSLNHEGVLMFNNTEWNDDVDDSANWKPLADLFN